MRAALVHLEGQVINLACDDIGGAANSNVLLPMLCERLEAKFDADVAQRKAAIEQAVIVMPSVPLYNALMLSACDLVIPQYAMSLQRACMHA